MAKEAKSRGLTCTPHAANHSLVTLFTAHLLGAVENRGKYMEYSNEETPWVRDLYDPFLDVNDGKIRISGEPGWGVTIREDWLEKAERTLTESE